MKRKIRRGQYYKRLVSVLNCKAVFVMEVMIATHCNPNR